MMTELEIKNQVLGELGHPTIKVEIDESQWCTIFKKSLRWFKARKGLIGCEIVPLTQGKVYYDFPVNANSISDIYLPIAYGSLQSLFSQGILDTNLFPVNSLGNGGYGSIGFGVSNSAYLQVLQALESTRRIISAEPAWEIQCGKIVVNNGFCFSSGASGGQYMLVFFAKENFDVTEITDARDVDLIYRYVEATAKKIVGRVRSKYKSYPAAGGTIDTDGPDLLEEARVDFEKLEEEIAGSQYPMGFLVG